MELLATSKSASIASRAPWQEKIGFSESKSRLPSRLKRSANRATPGELAGRINPLSSAVPFCSRQVILLLIERPAVTLQRGGWERRGKIAERRQPVLAENSLRSQSTISGDRQNGNAEHEKRASHFALYFGVK